VNPAPTIALVDMASVCPGPRSEAEYRDAIDLTGALIRRVAAPRRSESVGVHEVVCRLYGGWFAHDGTPMQQRSWLLRSIRRLSGLEDGVRIVPEIADSLACTPQLVLWGTYKNREQKMVDQMLSHDALFLARQGEHESLLIISDDEDFVPAVLVITSQTSARVCWMRQRDTGSNDYHFDSGTVELLTDPAWP
jgi:hypothetical protein